MSNEFKESLKKENFESNMETGQRKVLGYEPSDSVKYVISDEDRKLVSKLPKHRDNIISSEIGDDMGTVTSAQYRNQ